jgi:hypothetical protein
MVVNQDLMSSLQDKIKVYIASLRVSGRESFQDGGEDS